MAIKMVRQPSNTPNINNIDDIVGLRYAYGNQDGYVIGKGNELSHTINGNNFKVNSGRIVLQGVESDIDANGVTLTVDNVSELRYYTVYYQVNMATNTTAILLSNYDTATYPVVDKGDDLTENTIGIANLELYHFKARNGIISDVYKIVKSIEYVKNVKVNNAINSDNLNNIQTLNGRFLQVGDTVIPYKKLLYSGRYKDNTIPEDGELDIDLSGAYDKRCEIIIFASKLVDINGELRTFYIDNSSIFFRADTTESAHLIGIQPSSTGNLNNYIMLNIKYETNGHLKLSYKNHGLTGFITVECKAVYEIIE